MPEAAPQPKRGRGRPRKDDQPRPQPEPTYGPRPTIDIPVSRVKNVIPGLGPKQPKQPAQRMSETEAAKLKPALVEAIMAYATYADQLITATTKKHIEVVIWGDLDQIEAEVLADVWLRRAKNNAKSAQKVRQAVDVYETKIRVALILLPRTIKMWHTYMKEGIAWPR